MSKKTIVWLIVAASLILFGAIIFFGAMTVLKWDFKKLSTDKYEDKDYTITESYRNISVKTNVADVVFVPSDEHRVTCTERKNLKYSVSVKDETLIIECVDTRKWYNHIGIFFGSQKITVYIPQGEYGALSVKSSTCDVNVPKDFKFESIDIVQDTGNVTSYASAIGAVKIKTSTGDIKVEGITAGSLDLSVSTGKITVSDVNCTGNVKINVTTGKTVMTNVTCTSLKSDGDTGSISLSNVIATESFDIERSTGDVKLDRCDAAEIFIETDTGDVEGSLISDKVFITETDTGSVNVPKSVTGGRCEITTDTGDIKIKVVE